MEALEPRFALDASALRITEFVASNDNSLDDYDGDSSDWLEIYNSGLDLVDLSGLHLTDNASNLSKWTFPAGVELAPGGYLIVFASSKNTVKPNGELHTNFALGAGGEYLGLIAADGATVIDAYSPGFPAQTEDISYGRAMSPTGATSTIIASNAIGKAWRPTSGIYDSTWKGVAFNDAPFNIVGQTGFGYENSPGDSVNYTAEIKTAVPSGTTSLYIRIQFNLATLAGIDKLTLRMMYDDGFVAYLNGAEIAEANVPEVPQWNSVATTYRDDAQAEVFQDFDVSTAIPRLRLGANVLAIQGMNNNSSSGDLLFLPELVAAASELVVPDDFGYFDDPTPGYGNPAESFAGFAADPVMSVPHGFYSTSQSVAITSATAGASIVYTNDGSMPQMNSSGVVTNGVLYTSPITVSSTTVLRARAFKTDFKPSFTTASTYLFLNDVISQSPLGQVPPGFAPNGLNGQEMNYGIDPEILALYGTEAVKTSLQALPTISISTDKSNLFNASTGIYVNATNRGKPWERPASVEMINPDGSAGFTVNAGLRIRGGYSRNDYNPKHAFRLYFRGEYGDSHLEYPLFGNEGANEFDVLDLRTSQNYSWSGYGNVQESFVREVFSRDLMRDMGEEYTRSRYYHLYLDGVYWGLYQSQERVEEFYGETYFGGDEADYDVVKHGLDIGSTEISAGNDEAWHQLFDFGQALSTNPSANANVYWTMQGLNPDGTRNPALPVLLDVDNLIDFMSIIIFTGGFDVGLSRFLGDNQANNWFGIYNRVTADRGFQFYIHDNEHSLGADEGSIHGSLNIDRTGPFNNGNQNNFSQFNPQYLHQDLLASPEYKQAFIDHIQKYMFNFGALTYEANIERLQARVAEVDGAVIAESARWGDAQVTTPLNKTQWQAEINWFKNTYFIHRPAYVLSQLRNDGLFTSFAAPTLSQFGGEVPAGYQLSMSGGAGTIYYTTDGVTDPRAIGGGVNSSGANQVYTGAIAISGDTVVKARLRTPGGQWSGLIEASFFVDATPGDYSGDGVVDGADLLKWQQTQWSQVAPGSGADGSRSGRVDGADLALWRNYLGAEYAVVAASADAGALIADERSLDSALADVAVESEFPETKVAYQLFAEEYLRRTASSPRRNWDRSHGVSEAAVNHAFELSLGENQWSHAAADDLTINEAGVDDGSLDAALGSSASFHPLRTFLVRQ